MIEPLEPAEGLGVLHLFVKTTDAFDDGMLMSALKRAEASDVQVVGAAILGHKADACLMLLGKDWRRLRGLQRSIVDSGLVIVDSYVSLTEVSEYAKGMPESMLQARLYPQLPPAGKSAFCFYPMSKRRGEEQNWFTLPYEARDELMREHGATGRTFAGRVVQLITGSTGVDNYEWGVTLFAERPDDLKEVVYKMRFDRASATYAEFGPFYAGYVVTDVQLAALLR